LFIHVQTDNNIGKGKFDHFKSEQQFCLQSKERLHFQTL
ncbi:hypothetical protein T11_15862, partial [Trichinella zimbabwensis]